MSTRKGESTRKRAQKYQNTRAFKNDLYDKTVQTKVLNNLHISNVCARCKSILDWKIKYKKFKPLKAAATCTKCSQKCVKHAYHIMCKPCADKNGVCPKCGKKEELVEPEPTPEEQLKMDQEMQAMLKSLPERKRRTFLRFMEKGTKKDKDKKKKDKEHKGEDTRPGDSKEVEDEDEDKAKIGTQDLMAFLQRLKLSCKEGDSLDDLDDFDGFGDSDSDDFGSDDDDDDEEEEEEEEK